MSSLSAPKRRIGKARLEPCLEEVNHPDQRGGSTMTCERSRIIPLVGAERVLASKASRIPRFGPLSQHVAFSIFRSGLDGAPTSHQPFARASPCVRFVACRSACCFSWPCSLATTRAMRTSRPSSRRTLLRLSSVREGHRRGSLEGRGSDPTTVLASRVLLGQPRRKRPRPRP